MEICHEFNFLKNRKYLWNSFKKINYMKNPQIFFKKVKDIGIDIPEWFVKAPKHGEYLKKKTISYGGKFVSRFNKKQNFRSDRFTYFQKFIRGETISVQFFANPKYINLLSVCSQFENYKEFNLEGIYQKKIDKLLEEKIYSIIGRISKHFNLVGINSIDFIIPEVKKSELKLLEINPRPGLSSNLIFNLYRDKIFSESLIKKKIKKNYITSIIYSLFTLIINKQFLERIKKINSMEFSELPILNSYIKKGDPLCLVHQKLITSRSVKKNYNYITKILNYELRASLKNESY